MTPLASIEKARAEDIPDLSELLALLFTLEQDMQPDTARQIKGLTLLLQDSARSQILVARDASQRAIAMVSAQLTISTAEGGYSAWIEDLIIAPAFRGQGLGRALLSAILAWAAARGATRAQLLADIDNLPAQNFYQHLGWESMHMGAKRIFLRT